MKKVFYVKIMLLLSVNLFISPVLFTFYIPSLIHLCIPPAFRNLTLLYCLSFFSKHPLHPFTYSLLLWLLLALIPQFFFCIHFTISLFYCPSVLDTLAFLSHLNKLLNLFSFIPSSLSPSSVFLTYFYYLLFPPLSSYYHLLSFLC